MPVYLSPGARLKLCRLIEDRIKRGDMKFYATLGRVGLKGPAFYAYVDGRSIPSDEVLPRIISLALVLDHEEAVRIVREDLEGLTEFVDRILGFASAGISSVDRILKGLLGPAEKKR